jgi:catechol 2,3-dioxygenase-like lactoylglutathione lyase family enzyme
VAIDWQLTVDCRDPGRLVAFWTVALGYEVQPPPEGFVSWRAWYVSHDVPGAADGVDAEWVDRIRDPEGAGPRVWFRPVDDLGADAHRFHLDTYVGRDLAVDERLPLIEARVAALLDLGGEVADRYDDHVVVRDPEGHLFCVA